MMRRNLPCYNMTGYNMTGYNMTGGPAYRLQHTLHPVRSPSMLMVLQHGDVQHAPSVLPHLLSHPFLTVPVTPTVFQC